MRLGLYHARLRRELELLGGSVEKFIGDAVVGVFGAPAAREDDPERAVRAALAIRDWATQEDGLDLRIAVNTGEALVTLTARPDRGEGLVAGDVVNTTARVQSAAPANGILVGETTYRASRDRIEYREAAPVEAKGKAEPIHVWEAVATLSRPDEERQPHAPFIGRGRELRLLVDLLERVREELSPQLVTIIGPPGIGKSRLIHELLRHVEGQPEPVTWCRGRSLPYGETGSFWALADIVKGHLGVRETDRATTVRNVVHSVVQALLGNDRRVERHLAGLLGLDIDEAQQVDRDDAFAAWRRFFEAVAERDPLVLVFDDLQWADDALLDFVDYLVDWASGVPMLVLATARPELLERRPSWGGGKLNASTLALSPLDDVDSARLVASLLERPLIDAQTQSALIERVGGNPLYAEQYALLLREREAAADLPLPEGVQGIIAARLDLLPEEEKSVLQDAAVLGKVFWPGALGGNATSVARTLHGLERKDFVRRERVSSVDGEDEFVFRHLLARDVAYSQIPRAARAERHRQAAAWIESLSSERDDHAELVADHYSRALDLAQALRDVRPDDEQRARRALERAGDHTLRLAAFARAATFYEQALGLSPPDDERPRLLLAYGKALQRLVDARGEEVLAEAGQLLRAAGDAVGAGEAEAERAELLWFQGNGVRAVEHARRAVELLRESPASVPKAYAMSNLARIETFTGGIEYGVAVADEAVEIANTIGQDEVLAHALNSLGTAKANLGDLSGLADLERSIALALAVGSPEVCRAYNNLAGTLIHQCGEAAKARELLDEGQRVAEQLGIPHWIDLFEYQKAAFLLCDGDWDALLARAADEGDAIAEQVAFIYVARGELEAANRVSSSAIAAAQTSGRIDWLAQTRAVRVLVLRAAGDDEAAVVLGELMSSLASLTPWIGSMPLVGLTIADAGAGDAFLAATEDAPQSPRLQALRLYAAGEFAAAADGFAKLMEPLYEALARLRNGERLASEGRRAEADRELMRAVAFFRKARATRLIHEAERLLAATA